MMAQSQNELDTIRQRARQAVEYYRSQHNSASADVPSRSTHSASPHSSYQRALDKDGAQVDHYERVGGQVKGQRSSLEDILQSGVAPASSNSFYRAKMKAGIIDMRSSYSERIGSGGARQRSRTFHGPHYSGRTRTQTYAVDPNKRKVSPATVPERAEHPSPQPNLASPPSPPPPQSYHPLRHKQQLTTPTRTGGSRRNSRGLYRSNSNLEMDSVECIEDDLPPNMLHREYGSTSSLDLLAANQENYAEMLKDFKNGNTPGQSRLQQLLKEKAVNGSAERDEDDGSDPGKSKGKTKSKDRKTRAKSITGDSSASILKKLRGGGSKHDSSELSSKSEDKCNEESTAEDKARQKAFVHFDCQSIGVRLCKAGRTQSATNYMKNTTTGASAASVKRNSYAVSSDKDISDVVVDEDDEGDGKSNDLVLSCPFFRNEIGGESETMVSLTRLTAYKHLPPAQTSNISNNSSSSQSASAMSSSVRHPSCCGVAILDSSPSPSGQILPPLVTHRGHVIEYVDHGAYYYRHFFYGYDHQNFFGIDENLGPVAVSVRREKLDPEERSNNLGKADFGTYQYRIICRTSELTALRGAIIEDAVPSSGRLSSSRGVPMKDVLEMALGEIQLSCLKQALPGQKTADQLLKLDEQGICMTYKVGIMYCRGGQSTEEEMYNNESGSPILDEFLNLIGQKVRLKGFEKYRGGLDCKTDTTGLHSYYTTFNNNEIMFHVSTILPFTPNNQQQLLRKRHIGNDIVTIVFQEPGAMPFSPRSVRSQFQHVFIIIKVSNPNSENTRYSIAVTRSKDVPPFGPPIPENGTFRKSPEFVDFLIAKIINAENAAHKSEKFRTMAQRTRQEYLKDLATNYVTNNTLDSGSKLSKFALGSGRKKEKTKQKVVPDMYAKGALVWNVQVEDMSSAVQLECLLAIAADTIVLVEASSKDVIFTVPCSTIIGWTLQASSIRLYFGQGECILLRPHSGDMEEMMEIITRLKAVSQGTETVKMALKRNGLGQLGFHIQSEGIVTDVEPYGFAWEVGLRKGSRLVEICKVATITLTHDQIVDLLRTSAVVKVVVVPPLEDGTPRGYITLSSHLPFTSLVSLHTTFLLDQSHSLSHHTSLANQRGCYSLPQLPTGSTRGDGKPAMSGSRASINTTTAVSSSSAQTNHTTNNYYDLPQQRHSANVNAVHGYSDSTLSSGRGSDDGRGSSYYSHSRQESDIYGSSHGSHDGHLSSGDELHSRNGSHDSSDYSLTSAGRRGLSSTGRQAQAALRREGANYLSMEGSGSSAYLTSTESIYSAVSQHGNYTGQRRQFATMEYASGSMPVTGNIALELLKQTQNTKYLLGHEPPTSTPNVPGPATAVKREGAASQVPTSAGKQDGQRSAGRADDSYPRRKDSAQQQRKGYGGKKHLDSSPMSSNNSSPRSSSKNLSGMSSEESLNSRMRQRGATSVGSSRINFQEELKRLIDPDISESDLATLASQSRTPANRRGRRLQRTFSDESLHSFKGTIAAPSDISIGTDVIFTSTLPGSAVDSSTGSSDHTTSERLSPRAVLGANRPRTRMTVDGRPVPITDSTTTLDWSNLVNVATKAIEVDDRPSRPPPQRTGRPESDDEAPPPPRPPSPKDDVSLSSATGASAAWISMATTPEQRIKELEMQVQKLQKDLEKERERTARQDAEIQDLRADNVRLQEESQTAAAQLRRFTEWFFNTIDRQ